MITGEIILILLISISVTSGFIYEIVKMKKQMTKDKMFSEAMKMRYEINKVINKLEDDDQIAIELRKIIFDPEDVKFKCPF